MRRYINFKRISRNFKQILLLVALLICTGVTLARAETRTMNSNLNRSLDLRAMADINEQLFYEEEPESELIYQPQPQSNSYYQQPAQIRYEAAMAHTADDLWWLALAIHYEAGSDWLSDEHQLKVGNVVLNRVASSRFAGTSIHAILHQPGQYPWAVYSNHPQPSARSIKNAQKLLDGYRLLPYNVIWQANFRQGSNCYSIIECPRGILRTTFFCY